jgi:hypothetical protein
MSNNSLSEFVEKALVKGRISFGDVRRLQRDILPDGLASRADAELLLTLDGRLGKVDAAWERFIVRTIVDFVVWSERPTGIVDEDTAEWLARRLAETSGSRARARSVAIAREIAEEAHAFANDALESLAGLARPAKRPARAPQAAAVAEACALA